MKTEKFRLDPIFLGIVPVGARKALVSYMQKGTGAFNVYVAPFAGQFSITDTFVAAGVEPSATVNGDITLFSSVLGYAFDPTKAVSDLGFMALDERLVELLDGLPDDDDYGLGGSILLAIKWSQLQKQQDFVKWQRRELVASRESIYENYRDGLKSMGDRIGGLVYETRDALETMADYLGDEKALIWYDPPWYKGGYTKMFQQEGLYSWNDPNISELDAQGIESFAEKALDAAAEVLVFVESPEQQRKFIGDGWCPIFSELNAKTFKQQMTLTNRPTEDQALLSRRKFSGLPNKLPPIYDHHEITAKSKLEFVKVDAATGLYFYDLMVKGFAISHSEIYYLWMVDGQAAGVCGWITSHQFVYRDKRMYNWFAFTVICKKYPRLNRLMVACFITQSFVDQFFAENVPDKLMLAKPDDIQTTCLSKYPELKTMRGLFKLVSRERFSEMKASSLGYGFRLVYRAKIRETTYEDMLLAWLKKYEGQHG